MITTKVHDGTGTILLDRPEKRNALTRAMLDALRDAFDAMHLNHHIRAVILTGSGTAFCAGMDLEEMHHTAELDEREIQWGRDAEIYRDLLLQMLHFPKPIVAAVGGPAVAGGAGLVLACDLVIATRQARFGFPEPRRGIVAGVVAPLLAFRVGAGTAARLLINPTLVDAEETWRLGVYHELVDDRQDWVRASQVAEQCASGAPAALQLTKRLLNETIGERLIEQLAVGAAASATARTTAAAAEGLQAFLERRAPCWNLKD